MRSESSNARTQTLPLSGVRVIELGAVVAGPFCGGLLADYGAEVIKVEPVDVGDSHRQIGRRKNGVSLWWGVSARSKRCISLNLKDPESMSLLLRLLDTADVVTENFRPGVMDRLGLGWDVLSWRNPRLTMLSISGYGQTGPKSGKPGFGKIAEGLSGMLPLTGSPMSNAVFIGFSLADTCAAMFGVFGIMMALYLRDLGGGHGRFIDLALYESLLRMLDCQLALHEHAPHAPRAHRNNPYAWGEAGELPEQFIHMRSRSGQWLAVLVPDQMVEAAIRSRLCSEGADADASLEAMLLAWGKTQASENILTALKPLGAEIASVFDGLSIAREPYFRARGDVLDTESEVGPLSVPGPYPKLPTRLATMNRFKPTAVGADNQAVLGGELGVSDEKLEELKTRGAI
jgi:crotonobetainyl-CoA:carnitine CoA-transferase CaiB-like acyl-CoA transferase